MKPLKNALSVAWWDSFGGISNRNQYSCLLLSSVNLYPAIGKIVFNRIAD
jgi:hypothetical protein